MGAFTEMVELDTNTLYSDDKGRPVLVLRTDNLFRVEGDVVDVNTTSQFTRETHRYVRDSDGGVLVARGGVKALAVAHMHPLFSLWVRMVTSGEPVEANRLAETLFGYHLAVTTVGLAELEDDADAARTQMWRTERAKVVAQRATA